MPRDHVDVALQEGFEFVLQVEEIEQRAVWLEIDEQVHVAARRVVITSNNCAVGGTGGAQGIDPACGGIGRGRVNGTEVSGR